MMCANGMLVTALVGAVGSLLPPTVKMPLDGPHDNDEAKLGFDGACFSVTRRAWAFTNSMTDNM
jgi:hypothetical protein